MIKVNDTIRFILPMLYNKELGLNDEFFFNEFLCGIFTSDLDKPELDDKIFLVYKYLPGDTYSQFEDKLKIYLDPFEYNYFGDDISVYVLEIPKQHIEDYFKINQGLFDMISSELKLKIIKMWRLVPEDELFKIIVGEITYEGEPFENEILNINDIN